MAKDDIDPKIYLPMMRKYDGILRQKFQNVLEEVLSLLHA